MAQNSSNIKITNLADGFDQAGGTTARKLTVIGADITLTGSGTAVHTFPATTSTLARTDAAQTFTGVQTMSSTIELGNASDTTLSRSAAGVLAVEGVVVRTNATTTETSNATTTVAITSTNHTHTITALAVADAIAAPTSAITLTDNNTLVYRIKDNATARALTWNAIFRFSTDLAAPSTTVLSKTLYVGFKYNSVDTKWDCLAILNNF